jgi:glycosyltransferase involved in cell wall biosynthesis
MSSLESPDWRIKAHSPVAHIHAVKAVEVARVDAPLDAGPPPVVTVVVPTYRRPAMLARCLEYLLRQSVEPADFEIIVCDDGPDDDTRRSVEALAARHRHRGPSIRYLPVTATQGPAGARNVGWRAARAPLIAFTDDDTEPDPRWLSEGLAALKGGTDAVAGRIHVPLPPRPTDYELDASGLARAEFATANAFVQRFALMRTGGFDERFTAAWREDSDLQFALLTAGMTIRRAERAVVHHPVRPTRWGVSLSQQRKSQFDALLFKKYPRLFRMRIAASAPRLYYAILFAAIAGLVCTITDAATVARGAFILWAALTTGFCMRRLKGTALTASHITEMIATSILIPFISIFWRAYGALRFRVWFP